MSKPWDQDLYSTVHCEVINKLPCLTMQWIVVISQSQISVTAAHLKNIVLSLELVINCRSLLGYLESYRLLLAVIFSQPESKRHFLALLCSAAATFCTSVPALISHRWLSSPFFEAWLCRHPAISHGTLVSKRSVKAKNCSSVHIYERKSAQMQKLVLWIQKGLRNSSESFPLCGAILWKSHLEIFSYICLTR